MKLYGLGEVGKEMKIWAVSSLLSLPIPQSIGPRIHTLRERENQLSEPSCKYMKRETEKEREGQRYFKRLILITRLLYHFHTIKKIFQKKKKIERI
jgi:hypothetical protein